MTAMTARLFTATALGLALVAAGCSKQSADAGDAPAAPTAAPSAMMASADPAPAPMAATAAMASTAAMTTTAPAAAPAPAAPSHNMAAMAATKVSVPATETATATPDSTTPAHMKDFTLVDQNGKSHELYAMKNAKAVVLIWQGVGCPIVQQMTPAIKEVAATYAPKGVEFMMINSNIQDTPAMIKQEMENFDFHLPALKDVDQKVGLEVGVQRTAEVVVIDPKKNFKVIYHGPLDDRLTYGRARAKADNNWVSDVLDAMLAGKDVPVVTRPADGCIVNFPTRQT